MKYIISGFFLILLLSLTIMGQHWTSWTRVNVAETIRNQRGNGVKRIRTLRNVRLFVTLRNGSIVNYITKDARNDSDLLFTIESHYEQTEKEARRIKNSGIVERLKMVCVSSGRICFVVERTPR